MGQKTIWNQYPATRWQDATPLGNGRLGASVYGCVYDERILLNHEELFAGGGGSGLPDVSGHLGELRALLDAGEYERADRFYPELLRGAGFSRGTPSYLPAADLRILTETDGACEDYRRTLDLETGIATVSWTECGRPRRRECFVSQTAGALAVCLGGEGLRVKIALLAHEPEAGEAPAPAFDRAETELLLDGAVLRVQIAGVRYTAAVRVIADRVRAVRGRKRPGRPDMDGEQIFEEYIEAEGREVLVLCNVFPGEEAGGLKGLFGPCKNFETLKTEHAAAFSEKFGRVSLILADSSEERARSNEELLLAAYSGTHSAALVERMADFGRYLLISSSCGCSEPVNLQGLWNGSYHPAWNCAYFNNENIQMSYWQALAGGLSESLFPLFDLYERCVPDYRENARKLYGCRGILVPLFQGNADGLKNDLQPHVVYWTASSAWVSAIWFDYYLYTGDKAFLRKRAYPFMREAAQFYEDFLVEREGVLHSYPGNSPENRPDGTFAGAGEVSVCADAVMDFATVRELLCNLVESAETLGIWEPKLPLWKSMLGRLPAYRVNEDGAFREWLAEDLRDNYRHRHLSHLYPLFPGLELSRENGGAFFEAIRVAAEKRLAFGLKDQTGWSLAHMANVLARLEEGDRARECLDLLIRFCTGPNLYTYHNDWRNMGVTLRFAADGSAPFQIDADLGFVSAVYEMLVYSGRGVLKLLPALPAQWTRGRLTGFRVRGGLTLDLVWDGEGAACAVECARDCELLAGFASDGLQRMAFRKGVRTVLTAGTGSAGRFEL